MRASGKLVEVVPHSREITEKCRIRGPWRYLGHDAERYFSGVSCNRRTTERSTFSERGEFVWRQS